MDSKEIAEVLYAQAVESAFAHQQIEALKLIDQALSLYPNSSKYIIEKGEILCELGKPEEAISFMKSSSAMPYDLISEAIKKISEELDLERIKPKDSLAHKKLDKLMKWGKENGINTDNIKVVYYGPDFRGVHATRRIRKGERIITAPEKTLVTLPKMIESCPLAQKVANCGVELWYPFATALACTVYEMKNDEKSWWNPYSESFPEDAVSFPYFFSESERKFLTGTTCEFSMIEEINQSADEYNAICEKLPEMKAMTAKEYLKLTTLACSRYFYIKDLPGEKLAVPIIDMFNYYIDKVDQTIWNYDQGEKAFSVIAERDIKRGEIIGLNYGSKTNAKYLQYYGFIPENNDCIYFLMTPYMSETDPLLKKKQELLFYYNNELHLYGKKFYVNFRNDSKINNKILGLYRFAAFDGDIAELAKHVEGMECDYNVRYKKLKIPPLSVKNETMALEMLKGSVEKEITNFQNKLEHDEELLLKDDSLTFNAKAALIVRISEQRAYRQIMEFAEDMIKFLELSKDSAQKKLESMPKDLWYRNYASEVALPLLN